MTDITSSSTNSGFSTITVTFDVDRNQDLAAVDVQNRVNRYSSLFISNYIDLYLRDAIKRVKGVGDVIVFGERKFAIRLWLDPNKLASRRMTGGDVVAALREQNVQVAAGA